MAEHPIRLAIIIGSTREGRFGETVARWFADRATRRDDLDIDLIDLVEAGLPAVQRAQPTPEMAAFRARIGTAEAFVVVTPEYNHGYPAPLKLAIDAAKAEWRTKPAAFVPYGGLSGGLRAVEQLRQVLAELHVATVRDTVSFHMTRSQFEDAEGANTAATVMLDQLVWWALALREPRAKRPYGGKD